MVSMAQTDRVLARWFIPFSRGGKFGFRCFDKEGKLRCFSGFTSSTDRDHAALRQVQIFSTPEPGTLQPSLFPATSAVSLPKLANRFRDVILARGSTPDHAEQQHMQVSKIISLANLAAPEQITRGSVELALGRLIKPKSEGGMGRSLCTANNYLRAFQSFCLFMEQEGITVRTIRGIRRQHVQLDIRNQGIPFSDEQLILLIDAARNGPPYMGIDGVDLALTFFVASVSGLRANELRLLRMAKLRLVDPPFGVTAACTASKNHKEEFVPFARPVAEFIHSHLCGKLPAALALRVPPPHHESECIKFYLKLAGIPDCVERVEKGHKIRERNLNFHSLRRTFVTRLARNPRLPPKIVQVLARHSKIDLTMNVYAQITKEQGQLASEATVEAVESTPVPIPLWPAVG